MVVFWLKGAPNGPFQGPQLSHEKSRYKIALWDKSTMGNWVLVAWKADKGISDDLGHVFVVFWLGGAPNVPPRVPDGPKWTTYCSMRSGDKKLHCGINQLWETGC